MKGEVRVPHPIITLHGGQTGFSCGLDGQVLSSELHGLFAGDTRVLSTYRFALSGSPWHLLGWTLISHDAAQWDFQNNEVREAIDSVAPGLVSLSLRRRIHGGLLDELKLSAHLPKPVRARFTFQLDADFSDIFEVKERTMPPRLGTSRKFHPHGFTMLYALGQFRRALRIDFDSDGPAPSFAGSLVLFDLDLGPGTVWNCRLRASPEVEGRVFGFLESGKRPPEDPETAATASIEAPPLLSVPYRRGAADLRALAVPQEGQPPYPAAGVPWFMTLFGRDTLLTALMSGLAGTWQAQGALAGLGALQALRVDDWRDAAPGKIPHEVRRGELAKRGWIPHTPYYGTHDASALYCLTLWHLWRWTGDRRILEEHLETARRAMGWCAEYGDLDGDGLLEYQTRSSKGYYNQGWKDSPDAVVHQDGSLAPTPLALVEIQGYLFAARHAMAELLEASGDEPGAREMRRTAEPLRALVEERYWMEEEQFYAFGLDGQKKQVASVSSNPGHLLWCGLAGRERAACVGNRLLQDDLTSGWGLRTLSARHPAYNPLSYHRGSVWPFDTLLAAAGLRRYGQNEQAGLLIRQVLEAASSFEEARLPELFCGFDRSRGIPVPYEKANNPQAWSAAAPILAAQLFLGLLPDAPRGRCFLSPWLPSWLATLEMDGIQVGAGTVSVRLALRQGETVIERLEVKGVEVQRGCPPAPLWGEPLGLRPAERAGGRGAVGAG
jgi:glycogen debranching enzyme